MFIIFGKKIHVLHVIEYAYRNSSGKRIVKTVRIWAKTADKAMDKLITREKTRGNRVMEGVLVSRLTKVRYDSSKFGQSS